MTPTVWISSLTFNDGTTLNLNAGDVVVIVGPNNSGKSATLRAIRQRVENPMEPTPVVAGLQLGQTGTVEDVLAWLALVARKNPDVSLSNPMFQAYGQTVHESEARQYWTPSTPRALYSFARFFCHLLTAQERLNAANPPQAIALTQQAPTHPIHYLQYDDQLEKKLSERFRKAFGVDLIVHRNAGNQVPLYVGPRPVSEAGEDRISRSYLDRLERLPQLHTQGDGMRSFAGVLLNTFVGTESILLIDEPEAFLHPPQARLLGRMLAADKPAHRQLFVATHSGDVLRGLLDGNRGNVRVVRIRREGDVNPVKELEPSEVSRLWTDPLLRASNILDGVFHERVVVTEADGDARFFSAVSDALYDGPRAHERKPDVMFTHVNGKSRLDLVVRSLRALDVPVRAVADFDVLNGDDPLAKLVRAAGGGWDSLRPRVNVVKSAVDQTRPPKTAAEVKAEIEGILSGVSTAAFPKGVKSRIEAVLRDTSPLATAKRGGRSSLPGGDAIKAYDSLTAELRSIGIFVVDVGELERFDPSVAGHGPDWVNEVLAKDLGADPAFHAAREFVGALLR